MTNTRAIVQEFFDRYNGVPADSSALASIIAEVDDHETQIARAVYAAMRSSGLVSYYPDVYAGGLVKALVADRAGGD